MKSDEVKSVVFKLSGLIFMQRIQFDLRGSTDLYSYLFIINFVIHQNDVIEIINKPYGALLCLKKNKKL